MNRRHLLYVSSTGASLTLASGGTIHDVQALPGDVDGWEQFNSVLLKHPRIPVCVVIDSVEELYRSEILPRAIGRDRQEMTRRRLRQILHQTPYRTVIHQGRSDTTQVGDRYLFMGLTAPDILRPWLEVIKLRRNPLAGVWLLPVLSQSLIARFSLDAGQLLLVSEQTGGLRLSYFVDGRLRFSRLAPVDNALYDNPLEGYGEEIGRTRQFLLSQRMLAREDRLKVYLFDPLGSLAGLHAMLPEAEGFQCETIQRARILSQLHLSPALLSESSDAIFLALLPQAPRQANLLPAELRQDLLRYQLRHALNAGSALTLGISLALGVGLSAWTWKDLRDAEQFLAKAHSADQQARSLIGHDAAAQRFETIHAGLNAWASIRSLTAAPGPAMSATLQAAAGQSAIQLRQMHWSGPAGGGGEHLQIQGEIAPFDGDYPAAYQAITRLAEALQRAGWQADVTLWPMDPGVDQEIQGAFGTGQATQPALFSLQLRRGKPHAE